MKKGNQQNAGKFDAAFDKFSSMLPKDYKDQFKKPDYAQSNKKEAVKDSLRKGNAVIVTKQAGNKQGKDVNIAKLMDPEKDIEIKTVPKEISDQVKQARAAAEKTQDQLAKMCDAKVHAIKDLENGEGAYDPKLVTKIETVLKVKFTRSWKKK